jgi:Domain of unknown function (DUF1707)
MNDGAGRYPPTMRASDADRDAVLAELGEHFQAGRLTSDELEERTGQTLQARTFGELARLTADLPSPARERAAGGPPGGAVTRPGGRPLGLAPVLLGLVTVAVVAAAFLDTGAGTGGIHVLWLIILVPLVARMLARRRR